MGDPVSERSVVKNPNFWHPVEVTREWPDLDALGAAGARMKMDILLLKPEGLTPEDQDALGAEDLTVLRAMAAEQDPAFGVTHQTAAIGALAERRDGHGMLLLAEQARDRTADDRVRIAAIHALGEIGGPGVGTVMRDLLSDKQAWVRVQAVRGLAKVGTAADIGMLEGVAADGDAQVADVARQAAQVLRGQAGLE